MTNLDENVALLATRIGEEFASLESNTLYAQSSSASGSVITLTDADDANLLGLTVYGKSTQADTPTPESPVDIESIADDGELSVYTSSSGTDTAESSATLSDIEPLRAVPTTKTTGNYTDADGTKWWADKLIVRSDGSGYIERICTAFELTEDDTWYSYTYSQSPFYRGFLARSSKLSCLNGRARVPGLCNFGTVSDSGSANSVANSVWLGVSGEDRLWIVNTDFYTLDDEVPENISDNDYLTAWLENLAENGPMEIVSVLEDPVIEELTEDQVNAFLALQTYTGTTNVWNSDDADMEVEYVQAGKTSITQVLSQSTASTLNKGVVELATAEETEAGTDETRAITPYAGEQVYLKKSGGTVSGDLVVEGTLTADGYVAESAEKLETPVTISLTGDATGSASFDGSANAAISTTLASSGVTAGSYGPSADASPAHSGTFSVPYVTVDAKGRVTAASTQTITLPSDNNTDTKVTQTVTTTSAEYPILTTATASQTATSTNTARFGSGVTLNPSTKKITATGFVGDLTGNADTATALETARTIQTNLASTSTASFDGTANVTPGVTGILPVANGGTGSSAGAVLLTGAQTVAGTKTFSSSPVTTGVYYRDFSSSDTQTVVTVLGAKGPLQTSYSPLISAAEPATETPAGLVVRFGNSGNTIVGAGEGQTSLMSELASDGAERLYLISDNATSSVITNANTYADRGTLNFSSSSDNYYIWHYPRINEIYKGDTPTVNTYTELYHLDSTASNSSTYRLACLSLYKSTTRNAAELRAYTDTSGSTGYAYIGVYSPNGGGTAYTYAPTPASGDSSTKIATTAWVNSAISSAISDQEDGLLSVVASQLAQSGYVKLSCGLILQWGKYTGTGSTITFPVAFTTACYGFCANPTGASTGGGVRLAATLSTTGMTLYSSYTNSSTIYNNWNLGTSGTNDPVWFAWGV